MSNKRLRGKNEESTRENERKLELTIKIFFFCPLLF